MKKSNASLRSRLQMESLEVRSLMAADIILLNGVLNIIGSDRSDQIEVAPDTKDSSALRVSITDRDNGQLLASKVVSANSVQNLVVHGGAQSDTVFNRTDKPAVIINDIGSSPDIVVGGTNRDVVIDGKLTNPQRNDLVMDYAVNYGRTGDGGFAIVRDGVLIVNGLNRVNVDEVLIGNGWGTDAVPMLKVSSFKDSWFFKMDQVRHIVINGTPISDVLLNRTRVPATILAGGEDDTVQGGSAADLIFGGSGNDTIFGGDGNDILKGGDDQDFLYGEGGSDQLFGDAGEDKLWGGRLDDFARGRDDYAVDYLLGGDGRDTFHNWHLNSNDLDQVGDWVWNLDDRIIT